MPLCNVHTEFITKRPVPRVVALELALIHVENEFNEYLLLMKLFGEVNNLFLTNFCIF